MHTTALLQIPMGTRVAALTSDVTFAANGHGQILCTPARLPKGTFYAGRIIRAVLAGVASPTSANTVTITFGLGGAGTVSDPSLCSASWTTASSGSNIPFRICCETAILTWSTQAVGASFTSPSSSCYLTIVNQGTTGIIAKIADTVNPPVSTANILGGDADTGLYLSVRTSDTNNLAVTFKQAFLELL